jgi:hypothetical protein
VWVDFRKAFFSEALVAHHSAYFVAVFFFELFFRLWVVVIFLMVCKGFMVYVMVGLVLVGLCVYLLFVVWCSFYP